MYMKRYWLKLNNIDFYRYPHKCYKMLLDLDVVDKKAWVGHVKTTTFTWFLVMSGMVKVLVVIQ